MAQGEQKIPYAGFRFVSALVNAGIWFGIGFGLSMGVSGQLVARGRFGPAGVAAGTGGVVFLASLFGRAGAQTGFLNMASSGKVALPERSSWGPASSYAGLWRRGLLVAALASPALALATYGLASGLASPSRTTSCLLLASVAALFAAVQSALLSAPSTLGALDPPAQPEAPSFAYLVRRVALPQALGNGGVSALIALGTFAPEGGSVAALAPDAAITALVIGAFMLLGSSGIVGTDRKLGRVAQLSSPAPSWLARGLMLALTVVIAGALGAGLGAALGARLPHGAYVAFKGLLGAAVAFALALPAGRAALAS